MNLAVTLVARRATFGQGRARGSSPGSAVMGEPPQFGHEIMFFFLAVASQACAHKTGDSDVISRHSVV